MRYRADSFELHRQGPRRLAQCAVLLAASLSVQPARAELAARGARAAAGEPNVPADALELRVSYRAPHECPSGSEFLEALQEHLAAGGAGAVDAEVIITRPNDEREAYELSLRLSVAGQRSESRTGAESCEVLMQLAALNASMARTPALPGGAMSSGARGAMSALPPSPPVALPSSVSLGTNDGEPARDQMPAGVLEAARRSTSAGEPEPRAFLLGEVRAASGMLPGFAWGRGVAAGVSRGIASLRLSATWWDTQRHAFSPEDTSPIPLEFEQRSLELAPCAGVALSPLLRLEGCALIAGHRTRTSAEDARLSGSLGAAALATLSPWRGLRVGVEGGLAAPIFRPSFGVDALRAVYEPSALQPSMRLAIGWEFGGGT